MVFRDLLDLPFNERSGLVCIEALRRVLPDVPQDVAEQLLVDHGRKDDHQHFYGGLNLAKIAWVKAEIHASTLISASVLPCFEPWYSTVADRAASVQSTGWAASDSRAVVQEHWQRFRTWMRAPVFLAGGLARWGASLHLVEGHTRLGLLRGLVREGVLPGDSKHQAWIGTSDTGVTN